MRIAILGNAGAGKSTLARRLATRRGAALMDLDEIAWRSGRIIERKPDEEVHGEIRHFCRMHDAWIVEAGSADVIAIALEFRPRLVFLNPGESACLENCRNRPWDPDKYESPQEQSKSLELLLPWVSDYYTRGGEMSLAAHRACFAAYTGLKIELTARPALADPAVAPLAWVE